MYACPACGEKCITARQKFGNPRSCPRCGVRLVHGHFWLAAYAVIMVLTMIALVAATSLVWPILDAMPWNILFGLVASWGLVGLVYQRFAPLCAQDDPAARRQEVVFWCAMALAVITMAIDGLTG